MPISTKQVLHRFIYGIELVLCALPIVMFFGMAAEVVIRGNFIDALFVSIKQLISTAGYQSDDLLVCLLLLLILGLTCALLWQLLHLSLKVLRQRCETFTAWQASIKRCVWLTFATQLVIFLPSMIWANYYLGVIGIGLSLSYFLFFLPPLHVFIAVKIGVIKPAEIVSN